MIRVSAVRAIVFSALRSHFNRRKKIATWLWVIVTSLIVLAVVDYNAHTPMPDGLFSASLFPRVVVMLYSVTGWTMMVINLRQQNNTVVSKLLPSLQPSLRTTVTLFWFVISLGVAVLFNTADRALLEGWFFGSSFLTVAALAVRFYFFRVFVFFIVALGLLLFNWQVPNISILQKLSFTSFTIFAFTIGGWLLTQRYLFDQNKVRGNGFALPQLKRKLNPTRFYRATIGKVNVWYKKGLFSFATDRRVAANRRVGLVFGSQFNVYRQIVQCFCFGLTFLVGTLAVHHFAKPISNTFTPDSSWALIPLFFLFQTASESLKNSQHDVKIVCLLPGVPQRKGLNTLIYKLILKRNLIYVFIALLLQTLLILALPPKFEKPIEILAQLFSLGLLMSTLIGFPGYAIHKSSSTYSHSLAILSLVTLAQIIKVINATVPTAMIVVFSVVCSAFAIANGVKTYRNASKILSFAD